MAAIGAKAREAWDLAAEAEAAIGSASGRMLAQGDLKLLALALIAEQPRHGYELIKLIEEKTSDCYSPSPGVVYPTLTFLEEAGYVTAESEGAKKRYTITEEGRAYLEENRDIADMILARLAAIGSKMARGAAASAATGATRKASVPQLVDAALENLRAAAAKRLEGQNGEAETRIVEILARAAQEFALAHKKAIRVDVDVEADVAFGLRRFARATGADKPAGLLRARPSPRGESGSGRGSRQAALRRGQALRSCAQRGAARARLRA